MNHQFWHNCWEKGKTGWQQQRVNTRLQRYWTELDLPPDATVFVPLCGDSLDMLWLREQGYAVLGSELSEAAVKRFFEDSGIVPTVTRIDHSPASGGENAVLAYDGGGIRILCGDFFSLRRDHLTDVCAVYDRAATVALPEEMRTQYADHLANLLPADTQVLLISMAYDQQKMNGPPFSVPDDEIHRLYHGNFTVSRLGGASGPEILGNLADRGLDTLVENVYHLKKLQ